jgi:DNA-binding NtrC family response regulator
MNLLFVHHNPEIQHEIDDFLHSQKDHCFYSRNTEDTIRILNNHTVDLMVLIINHMRDTAVLKYINDNYQDLEVLLIASEEYDEIINLFSTHRYKTVRLPLKLKDLKTSIRRMIADSAEDGLVNGMNE